MNILLTGATGFVGSNILAQLIFCCHNITIVKRINSDNITEENKSFIEKYHNYYDIWDSWEPSTQLEFILKTSIDKLNK